MGENVVHKINEIAFLFYNSLEQETQINHGTIRGEVYGGSDFHPKIGKLISRVTKLGMHGGDRKSEKYSKSSWLTP